MSVFLNDNDEHRSAIRIVYNRELGREPSNSDVDFWLYCSAQPNVGFDGMLAGIRDSKEAQSFRAKRGW